MLRVGLIAGLLRCLRGSLGARRRSGSMPPAQLSGRGHDRPAPRRNPRRPTGHGRVRQFGIADLQLYGLDRTSQGIGGNLREGGPGAGSQIGGSDSHDIAAVAAEANGGSRSHEDVPRIRGARYTAPDEPTCLRPLQRLRVTPAPAEAARALPQAFDQMPITPGLAGFRVPLRLV